MQIWKLFLRSIFGLVVILLLLAPLTVLAQNKVVVIPLYGDDPKPLKNIITVAKANGNFTDPVAAVNSISGASATNPYLVVIGPGVYTITQTLVMKEYVDILGSGENVTKLTGAISTDNADASSAIISGVSNSTLSSLTVENTGGRGRSFALYNSYASPRVSNVSVKASGGGTASVGVRNYESSPTMTNVTALASGVAQNGGIVNINSAPTMTDVTATALGGESNAGVFNSASSPTMTGVTATASGGSIINYGVYNESSSTPVVRRSTMEGKNYALYTFSGTATVSQSTLKGEVYGGVNNTCVACDNGSGTALMPDCRLPPPP